MQTYFCFVNKKGERKDIQEFELTLENHDEISRNKMSIKGNSYACCYDEERDSIISKGNSIYKGFQNNW